jgi:excisionase family DNA binding protein
LEKTPTTEPVVINGLLSLKSLAEYLDCGTTFAANLIASGAIPSFKVGSLRRVRKADVDEFISRCIKWKKD